MQYLQLAQAHKYKQENIFNPHRTYHINTQQQIYAYTNI